MTRGSAAWLLAGGLVAASAAASPRLEAEPAIAAWRQGDLLALHVGVENDGAAGRFTLEARSSNSAWRPRVSESLELAAGARKSLWIGLQPSKDGIELLLSRDGEVLDRQHHQVRERPWSHPLIVTLGPSPTGLVRMMEGRRGHRQLASLVETSPARLPPKRLLWPSIDILVWPAPIAHDLDSRQADALRRWVLDGGRLIAGTHPEDPNALASLNLVPDPASPDGQAAGWGRIEHVETNLARAPAIAWRDLFALRPEPPAARSYGPSLLARRALSHVEARIEPPLLAGSLLLAATLAALAIPPWLRGRRAARGAAIGRGRWPLSLAVIAGAAFLSLLIAHFGAGHGLAVDRLDIIDVDAATGQARARSILGIRRARAGRLQVDTQGAGRLRVIDGPRASSSEQPRADHALDGDGASSAANVLSWESVLLDARWEAEALALPDLSQSPEELGRSLGAVRAGLKRGQSIEWLPDNLGGSDLDWAARVLTAQRKGLWPTQRNGLSDVMEAAFFSRDKSGQWGWPASERWPPRNGETVLIALATGSSAPALLIDGRESKGEAWTVWRVRLPAVGGERR